MVDAHPLDGMACAWNPRNSPTSDVDDHDHDHDHDRDRDHKPKSDSGIGISPG